MSLPELKIWDRFVRVAHWLLVLGFATAYLTADELEDVHYVAGYTVATIVVLRILWGFVGPRRARFSDFVYAPRRVFRYFLDLIRFRSKRYVGHSPAGGAMVVALLLMLVLTTGTGMTRLAIEEGEGPLAPLFAATPAADDTTLVLVSSDDESGDAEDGGRRKESFVGELHETFGNITLFLVFAHIGGVLLASFAHRENLPRAMVTGRKRAGEAADL
jgi:cytochrome b